MKPPREKTDFPSALEPHLQTDWDIRGTANFMFGGTGCGLAIVAALGGMAGMEVRWPLLVALILIGLGLLSVLAKIGRPLRALNVVLHPRTSWMSREALAALPLFALGAGAIWWNDWRLAIGVAVVALFYLYCQARILTSCKGIPAWRAEQVTPLILASGLAEGAGLTGLFLVAGRLDPVPDFAIMTLPGLLILSFGMLVRYLAWIRYLAHLRATGAPAASLRVLSREHRVFGVAGHLLPALVLGLGLFVIVLPMALTIGGLWALYGGWRMKVVLINQAGHTQGLRLPVSPARGGGAPGPGGRPGWSTGVAS